MPLSTMSAPAPAKARAHARPMTLVEPVTTAVLPFRILYRSEGIAPIGGLGIRAALSGGPAYCDVTRRDWDARDRLLLVQR